MVGAPGRVSGWGSRKVVRSRSAAARSLQKEQKEGFQWISSGRWAEVEKCKGSCSITGQVGPVSAEKTARKCGGRE